MRRRRSERRSSLVALLVAFLLVPGALRGQGGVAQEGALFLLLPIGARPVALGQAVVAQEGGSDALWWNPAAVARLPKREVALHHGQTFIATSDAVSILVPRVRVGTLGLSVHYINYGEQEITDPLGTVGTLSLNSFVAAGTFATTLGRRLNAGVTFKVLQLRSACSGACQDLGSSATSSALDFGLQYRRPAADSTRSAWSVGAAIRHAGLRLQVKDEAQADPLPTRIQVGVSWRRPLAGAGERAVLQLSADLVDRLAVGSPGARLGGEVGWDERIALRAGYVWRGGSGDGPSVGIGYGTERFGVEIARFFDDFSSQAGEPPTYLSLRYRF